MKEVGYKFKAQARQGDTFKGRHTVTWEFEVRHVEQDGVRLCRSTGGYLTLFKPDEAGSLRELKVAVGGTFKGTEGFREVPAD